MIWQYFGVLPLEYEWQGMEQETLLDAAAGSAAAVADGTLALPKPTVFSNTRTIRAPRLRKYAKLPLDKRNKMDGLKLLGKLEADSVPIIFLDHSVIVQ